MKFYGYVRASTADQQLTLAAQEEQLRAWGVAYGHDITVHVESGVSGGVAPNKRPVLSMLLNWLDQGRAEGLVFVKLDRVSRSTRDVIDLVERAEKNGWALVSKAEGLDTKSAMGRFVVRLMASLAELEKDLVGERTKVALGQLRREGKRYSGHAPWGMRYEGKRLVPCEREREAADIIRERPTASSHSLALGLSVTFGKHPRTGQPWKASDVQSIRRALKRAQKGERA